MISVKIFDTPVKVKLTVLPIILVLWGGLTWFGLSRHPERGFWLSLLIGLAVFTLVRGSPVVRELMAFSAGGHGLLLVMSLFPLPLVDGGTLLKWSLVAAGRTPAQADRIVRVVGWVLGIVLVLIGIGLLVIQLWIAGLVLTGVGVIVLGAAVGKIK